MDVLSVVAANGSADQSRVAIIATDQVKSSYSQLLFSASAISSLLRQSCVCVLFRVLDVIILLVRELVYKLSHLQSLLRQYSGLGFLEDVSVVLSTENQSELLKDVAAKSGAQFLHIPGLSTVPQTGSVEELSVIQQTILKSNDRVAEDPALIIYTSGTTGKPKGVVHTHSSIAAQVRTLSEAWEYNPSDKFLHCLPLHHILSEHNYSYYFLHFPRGIHVHGLFNALLAPLYAGSSVEFLPKFSVSGIWKRWRESYPTNGTKAHDAVTVFTGVPTMYTRLIQGYEAMDSDLQAASASAAKKLRLMMCGSSALPYPVMQQWETITGHRLLERYGMTEFVMALSNPLHGLRKGGTVGKPFPGIETMILAEDESGDDPTGAGELCIRSPSLFKEYWKLPQVTEQSFIDGGFFKTGDAVKVDEDGYYIILGRTSADIMKVGGYKLSALEIEAVLLEHPTISECCVLGLPDKDYGEVVTAIVVPDSELKQKRDKELRPVISLEELNTWAGDKLATYKLPTRLYVWDSLPRNAMGKVNKKDLKKKLCEG